MKTLHSRPTDFAKKVLDLRSNPATREKTCGAIAFHQDPSRIMRFRRQIRNLFNGWLKNHPWVASVNPGKSLALWRFFFPMRLPTSPDKTWLSMEAGQLLRSIT